MAAAATQTTRTQPSAFSLSTDRVSLRADNLSQAPKAQHTPQRYELEFSRNTKIVVIVTLIFVAVIGITNGMNHDGKVWNRRLDNVENGISYFGIRCDRLPNSMHSTHPLMSAASYPKYIDPDYLPSQVHTVRENPFNPLDTKQITPLTPGYGRSARACQRYLELQAEKDTLYRQRNWLCCWRRTPQTPSIEPEDLK
jgi:hypothetical protein